MYLVIHRTEGQGAAVDGFFDGWTHNTVMLALWTAAGGILVAMSLKYTDSILKCLAMAGSVIFTTFLSWLLLGGVLTPTIFLAAGIVIISIFNYQFE